MHIPSNAYPQPRAALSLWAVPAPMAPPPAAIVAAVVMFGDLHEAGEDGTTTIRFSRARLEREDMRLLLGGDIARAPDVSVIWHEQEEQIVRVLDSAPLESPVRLRAGADNRYAKARMRGGDKSVRRHACA